MSELPLTWTPSRLIETPLYWYGVTPAVLIRFDELDAAWPRGRTAAERAASARVSARAVTMRSRRATISDRASSRRRPISARSAAVVEREAG